MAATGTAIDDKTAQKLLGGLRRAFPQDTISIRPGYKGRLHLLVVSDQFNGMTERQKQDYLWDIIRVEAPDVADDVSVTVIYGTDEL